jgi:hypothetical protein
MKGISWIAERLLAYQEGLCCMKLVHGVSPCGHKPVSTVLGLAVYTDSYD